MNHTRRSFLQKTSLLLATWPLADLRLGGAEPGRPPAAEPGARREVLFSPGNITDRKLLRPL